MGSQEQLQEPIDGGTPEIVSPTTELGATEPAAAEAPATDMDTTEKDRAAERQGWARLRDEGPFSQRPL